MSSNEEVLKTMAGLDASRRAAWAQVYKLRDRVAELEAQLGGNAHPTNKQSLIQRTIVDGRFDVEATVKDNGAGIFVQHKGSGRTLQLTLEREASDPDVLYGYLWIADGLESDDEVYSLWDTEVRLNSSERIEGGWEQAQDMTGTPSLRGEGDWGRNVELAGSTRDEDFVPGTRSSTFLTWGYRDRIPFIQADYVPSPVDGEIDSEVMQLVDGKWRFEP